MDNDDTRRLLAEIRDLHQEQLQLIRTSLATQQQAIARQEAYRKGLERSRKWTQILLGAVLALFIVYVLQPLLVLWFSRGR